jgi:hypothetical protein
MQNYQGVYFEKSSADVPSQSCLGFGFKLSVAVFHNIGAVQLGTEQKC